MEMKRLALWKTCSRSPASRFDLKRVDPNLIFDVFLENQTLRHQECPEQRSQYTRKGLTAEKLTAVVAFKLRRR